MKSYFIRNSENSFDGAVNVGFLFNAFFHYHIPDGEDQGAKDTNQEANEPPSADRLMPHKNIQNYLVEALSRHNGIDRSSRTFCICHIQ